MTTTDPKEQAAQLIDAPADQPVDEDLLRQLLAQLRSRPPTTPSERDEWLQLVRDLRSRVRRELTAVGRELRRTTKARRGLRGYGALKSVRHSQHTDKVV
ncbi:MAG: hypothetical protein KTR31_02865 [Myxococcales bacterium]|nr:hypothetical protein [Myxococcales bacterium]